MLRPRALAEPGRPGLYHVCSRVVDRRVIFGGRERRKFMGMIKGGAVFAGVEVVSWCLMGNHFHLLVRVPALDPESLSDEEVLARMEHIYPPTKMRHFRGVWDRMESEESRKVYLARFRARMGRLSEFVKTLKQRFTQWFNRRTNREGTLWEGRFFSVMLAHNESGDGAGLGVLARFVAGYIDLNPVRAKVTHHAGDSSWSSYGAALRGDNEALEGMKALWGRDATEDLDAAGLAAMHGRMLERALFRDTQGADAGSSQPISESGETAQTSRRPRSDPGSPSGPRSDKESRVSSLEPGEWAEDRVESRLFARMGMRCEALTRRRVLGQGWVRSQIE